MPTPDDYARKASAMWETFTPNDRALVRIGMCPAEAMNAAEKEGYETHPLAVALMNKERDSRKRGELK